VTLGASDRPLARIITLDDVIAAHFYFAVSVGGQESSLWDRLRLHFHRRAVEASRDRHLSADLPKKAISRRFLIYPDPEPPRQAARR